MSQLYLEVSEGDVTRRVPVGADKVYIGRQADCAVILADVLASRVHCIIERSPTGWYVRDLRSRNGTILNGQRIQGEVIRGGDVIQIGAASIRFVDAAAGGEGAGLGGVALGGAKVSGVGGSGVAGSGAGGSGASVGRGPTPIPVEEDLEVLSEEDLVEEVAAAAPTEDFGFDVIESEDEPPLFNFGMPAAGASNPAVAGMKVDDPEKALSTIANSLPDQSVREGEIVLVASRGTIMHGAKAQAPKAGVKREPVDLFRLLLLVCMRSRTTDIHLEPRQECYGIRLRVDGVMVDVAKVDSQFGVRMATLVKVLSDIDIAQRNALQEGHFSARIPSQRSREGYRRIDYRVSFAPSVFGQKLVIRILDAENAPLTLGDLKLPKWMHRDLAEFIRQDAGMVVVAGPTGSGKTTTLYSLLRSIDLTQRNAVTIEDPVEMQLEGTTQMPVDEGAGKGFGAILRSVLRQDPDVIMVGEIRDAETARTAMQAAITGHMVLSSIHTRDTLGTVFRLLDLGVEPYLVSQALNIVVAQRLVRTLCPFCRRKKAATPQQKQVLAAHGLQVEVVYSPGGCARCLGTGHSGRRCVFELLSVSDALRNKIQENATLDDLRSTLAGSEFVSLSQSGMLLVVDGSASYEEIERIADREGKRR